MPSSPALLDDSQGAVFDYLRDLQTRLADALSALDSSPAATLTATDWESRLGKGRTCALQGDVFERGGINRSHIAGDSLPPAATARNPHLAGAPYRAGGVSLVLHPKNPYCPTVHMNVRWFNAGDAWWFGGGMDLTPYYGFAEDCRHFHRTCKAALDAHDPALYPRWKQNCDEYFFIRHRNEARGIGGVFFDDFNERSFEHAFAVWQSVGDAFLAAYVPLIEKRRATPYGERERHWQRHRRGRYVEFNLVYDRGTLFGLQSGGNADAILMSLPPTVCWGDAGSGAAEQALLTDFLPARDWAGMDAADAADA